MQTIDVKTLKEKIDAGLENRIVVDVRDPEETASGMLPGAKNIPLSEISERIDDLKKFDEIFVNCVTGGRSSRACEILAQEGMNVTNIEGGYLAWKEAELDE